MQDQTSSTERLRRYFDAVNRELDVLEQQLQLPLHLRPRISPETAAAQRRIFAQHHQQLQIAAEELLQLARAVEAVATAADPAPPARAVEAVAAPPAEVPPAAGQPDPAPSELSQLEQELRRLLEQQRPAAAGTQPPSPRPADLGTARRTWQQIPHPEPDDSESRGPRHLLARRLEQTAYEAYYAHRTPAAFELLGKTVTVATWRELYLGVLQLLAERDPALFSRLPDNATFVTKTGQNDFSRRRETLLNALPLGNGLFVEGKRSAAQIAFRIGNLLDTFGIPRSSFDIILAPRPS